MENEKDKPQQPPLRPVVADGVRAQQTTVSGTAPADGEARELAVGDGLRRGRALLAA